MFVTEAISFAYQNLKVNKMRTSLTMLGMIIGTTSIILVVTIALTGRDYILKQIEAVGSNLIYVYYEAAGGEAKTLSDELTVKDLKAVEGLSGVTYAAAIVTTRDRVAIGGQVREVSVIGATENYSKIRNIQILSGRSWDEAEQRYSGKACLITEKLARRLVGSLDVRGKGIKLFQVRFDVIGVFKEGVQTFGQSEVTEYSVLVPLAALRRFTMSDKVDLIYVSARNNAVVLSTSESIRQLLEKHHRKGSSYRVENMALMLGAAERIGNALTLVLFLLGTISLVISGIGIMNIMLVTVSDRTKEIGIKMAIGARRREILYQFLTESIFLAISAGTIGIALGTLGPFLAGLLAGIVIPISGLAIFIAFSLSAVIGVTFGIIPANHASKLDPVEALRSE